MAFGMMIKVSEAEIRCEVKFVMLMMADNCCGRGDERMLKLPRPDDVAHYCGLSRKTAKRILNDLKTTGAVRPHKEGWWLDVERSAEMFPAGAV